MKRILLSLVLLPAVAWGAEPPKTVILPTSVVAAVSRYMMKRPFEEVAQMLNEMDACVRAQIPDDKGVVVSHGECPEVAASMQAKPAPHAPSAASATP
jgi:hypothetical protein